MAAAEGDNGNPPRGRRTWNHQEDEALLACLKELVAGGWKFDNGFRGGYVHKLEEMMSALFPLANIKGTPHIASKLTGWKKNYGTIAFILSRSGVGFNVHGDHKVGCDDSQWAQICSLDANAKNICFKSWPYYDIWSEVFGKDRATGEAAEDIMDAVNDLRMEDNIPAAEVPFYDATVDLEDIPDTPYSEMHSCQSSLRAASSSRGARKRKVNEDMGKNLCEVLGEMQRDTNSRLESISHRIGYASDVGKARKEIFMMLEATPELTRSEIYRISDILLDTTQRLEFFTSLPEEARLGYVRHLLLPK